MTRGNYNSGDAYVLEYGGLRFTFNEIDFLGRVHLAAQELGLLDGPLSDDTMSMDEISASLGELVDTVVNGEPPSPAMSPLGLHLRLWWESLEAGHLHPGADNKGLAHWMRRTVFRQAWIDQRVIEGELDPVCTDNGAFVYREAQEPRRTLELQLPSFASFRFRRP